MSEGTVDRHLAVAEPPAPRATVTTTMEADAAERFITALEWASARLSRGRRGDLALEQIRWLNWGMLVIAGQVGLRPPTPRVEEAPTPTLAPGEVLLDARGYRRGAPTLPGTLNPRKGVPPRTKGRRYDPDPPTTDEIVAFLQACPENAHGHRMRALVVLLWRSGLRISEALALEERDLHREKGELVVRRGKGGKRRISGMDPWGWTQIQPWLEERHQFPEGPVFCVLTGPTAGRPWDASQVRAEMRKIRRAAGIRRRIAPHQFRHRHTLDWVREGQNLVHLQRQLGHSDLGITTRYTAALSPDEVTAVSATRPAPVMPVPDLMGVLNAR